MNARLVTTLTTVISGLAAAALGATLLGPAAAQAEPATPAATAAVPSTTPGPGWYAAVVNRGPRSRYGVVADTQTLEVLSPTGERRVLLRAKVSDRGWGYVSLLDVSADSRTALVSQQTRVPSGQRVVAVDTTTLAQRAVVVPRGWSANLLSPDGTGVIVSRYGRSGVRQARLGWDSSLSILGGTSGRLVRAGATTILGQTEGRRARSLDVTDVTTGALVSRISTPGLRCEPVRAFDDRQVEVLCQDRRARLELRLVDPATGALSAVAADHPRSRKFFGDLDARPLPSGLYLQVGTACGIGVARQQADGSLQGVPVAKPDGNVLLVATAGSDLVITRGMGCRGKDPVGRLSLLDPVSGAETALVTLPHKEAFGRVVPLGEPQASVA